MTSPSIFLLSNDIISGSCERDEFGWNSKVFSLSVLLYHRQWGILPKREAGSDYIHTLCLRALSLQSQNYMRHFNLKYLYEAS